MKTARIFLISSWVMIIFVLLSACSNPSFPPTVFIPSTSKATRVLTPTDYPLPGRNTETITPDYTLTPVLITTSKTTSTPTRTVTWTPRSTLPPDESKALVLELLKTNGGCRLPCWWGITPGKTSWNEAKAYLSTFAASIEKFIEKEPKNFQDRLITYYALFSVFEDTGLSVDRGKLPVNFIVSPKDEKVDVILTGIIIPVRNALADFGEPDFIWFQSSGESYPTTIPPQYDLGLTYLQKGIMFTYSSDGHFSETERTTLEICQNEFPTEASVFLWSPQQAESYHDVIVPKLLGFFNGTSRLYGLDEVANMDTAQFYENYLEPNATDCIVTHINIWPDPDIDK